jgi:hypothetical protein
MNRRQADIPRRHLVLPRALQMLKEVQDLRGAKILKIKLTH